MFVREFHIRMVLVICIAVTSLQVRGNEQRLPHLQKQGDALQLIVDGEPFLMLAGELGNSSASNAQRLNEIWPVVVKQKLNTLLVPVYWELIEPEEGQYDFTLVDEIINGARKHQIKIIPLWFGSWKNSMSCYAPLWVKKDWSRFPRSKSKDGTPQEIMTPFSHVNLEADKRAYVEFLKHLSRVDSEDHTVIMIQLQNEIGMIPDARDYCALANVAFKANVPAGLMEMLAKNKSDLQKHIANKWKSNGSKMNGSWETVFGKDLFTDELFMAWYFAVYVEEMAAAGKNVYNLPVFLNAALNSRGRVPGKYPSAGPLAHLIDVWKTAAPSIDILSPDIYDAGFDHWCRLYHMPGKNPLFIPEIRLEPGNDARVFYAFGEHDAMGFSPFSIEDTPDPENAPLTRSYDVLHQLLPLMAKKQGKNVMAGVWFHHENRDTVFIMDGYRFRFFHDYTLGWSPNSRDGSKWPETGALIISLGDGEFIIAGTGVVVNFESINPTKGKVGIGRIDEVEWLNDQWISKLRLNGDQSHQGRHLRIPVKEYSIQKVTLYSYN